MSQILRLVIALAVFVSGIALVPLAGLPSQGYRWQTYADAYQPLMLEINYQSGSPGSFFTLTGFNFPADENFVVLANGMALGEVTSDSGGSFVFLLDTTGAEEGYYFVTTDEPDSPVVRIWLTGNQPTRPQEGEGIVFDLPGNLAINLSTLPMVSK